MNAKMKPLAILCALAVFGAPIGVLAKDGTLAEVEVNPYEVSLTPYLSYERHILRVSCNSGQRFQKQYEAGELPVFQALDMDGNSMKDGSCSYELRAIPTTEGTVTIDEQAYVQSGTLDISEGMMSQPARAAAHQQK